MPKRTKPTQSKSDKIRSEKGFSKNKSAKIPKSITANAECIEAKLVEINGTYGFAETIDGARFFIPGRVLRGAMPGDTVALDHLSSGKGSTDEAEIIEILEKTSDQFTGDITNIGGYAYIRPDMMPRELITVSIAEVSLFEGDKVLFEIIKRGRRHSDHQARVLSVFGDAEKASVCADAVLAINNIQTDFNEETVAEAKAAAALGIPREEYKKRLDLRDRVIFTIDGADTKDIDDAISVRKIIGGWELGIHIADVSYYVKSDSELDKTAMERGTSIYYADKVVPMLPKELSNGICSLNPDEDRLAFSCLMRLDEKGKLGLFKFSKTIIHSRAKGVYSEVNRILAEGRDVLRESKELFDKYNGLTDTIKKMDTLAEILIRRRTKRGAPEIETNEAKIILDENDICIDIKKRESGRAERIVEEFMLMANAAAAKLAKERGIPFVYRVHEKPTEQKIQDLSAFLLHIGINPPPNPPEPHDMARILDSVKESSVKPAVNMMVLRSMAKARYYDEPLGHYGLALGDYAHFTSPIRRYPDLAVHRLLTELCYNKLSVEKIVHRYTAFVKEASEKSSIAEQRAVDVERKTTSIFAAEYMKAHLGDIFDGVIIAVLRTGFFVELPNTAEGFVRLDSLPKPPYDYDGYIALTQNGKRVYTVGDTVTVQVAKADIQSARVDFVVMT
jgi:ribonuclease R